MFNCVGRGGIFFLSYLYVLKNIFRDLPSGLVVETASTAGVTGLILGQGTALTAAKKKKKKNSILSVVVLCFFLPSQFVP